MKTSPKKRNRRPSARWGNRMALIGITAVIASLAVVINISASSLRAKDRDYELRERQLAQELAKEESRAESLKEYGIYVQTKQYIEKMAKEKLGLVKKDEILLKPEESE